MKNKLVPTVFQGCPSLGVKSLDNSTGVALPSELYNASSSISLMHQLSPQTQLVLGVSPGIASDLEADSGDAFRMSAFAMVIWQKSGTKQWIFGVVVTCRDDIPDWAIWLHDSDLPRTNRGEECHAAGTQGREICVAIQSPSAVSNPRSRPRRRVAES